jgi:uncharacterized repeat protein (TIGR01451 family)
MAEKRSHITRRLAAALLAALLLLAALASSLRHTTKAATTKHLITAALNVVINEVAWAGTAASAWDEWIELYNTTSVPVSLDNWSLSFVDGSPAPITLTGTIPAGGFFVLERAEKATDRPADVVYGGLQMVNSGEGIRLRDASGTLVDTANGDGGAWPAGSGAPDHRSMERVAPTEPDIAANWRSNDGLLRLGHDADGNPLNATPGSHNSAFTGALLGQADLIVAKSGPIFATEETPLTYTIRISNAGSLTATRVLVTDVLPAGVTYMGQSGPCSFSPDGRHLHWDCGNLPPAIPPLSITLSGRLNEGAFGIMTNRVTVTTAITETRTADNHAAWSTRVDGSHLLISAVLYDGYQTDDRDEAVQLINVGDAPADLAGWRLCDQASDGTCVTIPGGSLDAGTTAWVAYWASDFYTSFGTYPAYALHAIPGGSLPLAGSWPRYANSGETVVLQNPAEMMQDLLVYETGDTDVWGWKGPAVQPWSSDGLFGTEGQILYRRLDEASGLPVPDTDSAADWAQYGGDPILGRRVRYPGWDLERFFQPLTATEQARVTVGVAPDNATPVVLNAIRGAEREIEIAVYSLRHPAVVRELVGRAALGVTVTVLLEGDPAGMPDTDPRWYQQMWACQALHATGRGACWFMINDPAANLFDRYRYTHAKYLLVDRRLALISTQNLTLGGLPNDDLQNGTSGSRGVVLSTDAPSIVGQVAQLFSSDLDPTHHADLRPWSPLDPVYGPPPPGFRPTLTTTDYTTYTVVFTQPLSLSGSFAFELYTAPEAALRQTDALLGLLARAGVGDQVYVQALDERASWGDDPVTDPNPRIEALISAARRGARVRILLNSGSFDADYYDQTQNLAAVDYANSVARREKLSLVAIAGDPTQYGIHNKMVLVWLDDEGGYVHVGSLNGGETASKANRELVIQIRSDPLFHYLKRVFDWDWYACSPILLPLVMRGWAAPLPPVPYPLISELLYDPTGAAEGGEWVELFNPTRDTLDLSGWRLGDVGPAGEYGSGLYAFPPESILPPGGIFLVARQADDVVGFVPDFEFVIDPARNDPAVPDMQPAGSWDGFGFALGNTGDEVILLDAAGTPVDVLVYGAGLFPGIVPHPGVITAGHSLERRPAIYDTDDCSRDFFDRYPPGPGSLPSK